MSSPCIRQCTLNQGNVCVGCGRTLDEITGWLSMTPEQRQQAGELAARRVRDLQPQTLPTPDDR